MSQKSQSPLVAAILGMTSTQVHALSTTAIASLSASDLNAFGPSNFPCFTPKQIAAIQPGTLAALNPNTFAAFNKNEVAALTVTQIASLTSQEVGSFSVRKLARLSANQIAAIQPAALEALGAFRLASLSVTQGQALTNRQLDALDTWEIAGLAAHPSLNVGPADIPYLSASRFALLNASSLNALSGAVLSSLNPAYFTVDQIAGLSSSAISNLTTAFFSSLSNAGVAAISTSALAGVSVADLKALSATQIASFSPSQLSAFDSAQSAVIEAINPLLLQAASFETNGYMDSNGAVAFLESVASGGMNAAKFTQLQALANKLQTPDQTAWDGDSYAILTSDSVKQAFDNVVFGTGDSSSAALSATSTQSQFQALINQWFLGSDLPALPTGANGAASSAVYALNASPLYDASGAASMTDVLQGGLNDSALLAGIAETAYQDPGYLQQFIVDNGNGTYQVELPDLFSPTFVTVTNELPVAPNGSPAATATTATGKWVGLLEKAAAQNTANNSYDSLTLDADDAVERYSGQYYFPAQFYTNESQQSINQNLTNAANAFAKGNNAVLQAGDQFYAVTGIDAAHGLVNVYDPLGGGRSTFTSASLVNNSDTLYYGITSRAAA